MCYCLFSFCVRTHHHTATEEEHDQRFENVVRVLSSKGLTLNRGNCQFKMSHLEFMGHVLSSRRIGPSKVILKKTVLNIDEPHLYGHRPMEKLKGRTALF